MRWSLASFVLLTACTPIEERYADAFVQRWVGTEVISEDRGTLPYVVSDPDTGVTTTLNAYLDARLSGAVVFTLDYDNEPDDEFEDVEINAGGDWRQLSTRPEAFDLDIRGDDDEELDGSCVMTDDFAALSCELEGTVYEFAEAP